MIIHSARQLVTPLTGGGFSVIPNGAIVSEGERIVFTGSSEEARDRFRDDQTLDASEKVILPGFVDAHTHAIFGGDRCQEFLMRLAGATYQEIAAAGGGILSTVKQTRAASADELQARAASNLQTMLQYGTTTVEIKSGYGLNWENERKILVAAQNLRQLTPLDVVITFLGAHDFPPEKSRADYVHEVIDTMLPEVAREKLAEFCDVFCDQGYYTADQTRQISLKARDLGMKIKVHVDELADVSGAALAAELRAVSADHLIFASEPGISAMAKAGVVAVLLPGTSFSLRMRSHAPARKMLERGVRVAIASDFNPGTCYSHSMQFILQLAALLYSLTPEEAITAATLNGAAAIDRESRVGSLESGKQMDCLMFDIPEYGHLFYNLGVNRLETVVKKGKIAWTKNPNLHKT